MKIYTKTGDKGETSLFDGTRVPKSALRVEAYGTVDELNSYLAVISSFDLPQADKENFVKLNHLLYLVGTDLATPLESKREGKINRISQDYVEMIENLIDFYSEKLPELKHFILPGGCFESAFVHIARTVCRRAERRIVELENHEEVNHNIVVFLNRLSDFLFVFARYINFIKNVPEVTWNSENIV